MDRFWENISTRHNVERFECVFKRARKVRYFEEFEQLYYELSRKLGVKEYLLYEYICGKIELLNAMQIRQRLVKPGESLKSALDFDFDFDVLMYEHLCAALGGGEDKLERIGIDIIVLYYDSLPHPGAVLPVPII